MKSTESTGWLKDCGCAMAIPGEQQQQQPDQPPENRALSNRATSQLSAAPARLSSQHLPTFHRAARQRHLCQASYIPVSWNLGVSMRQHKMHLPLKVHLYDVIFIKIKCIKSGGYIYGDHSRFNSCIGQKSPIFCGLVHHIAGTLVQKLRN